MLTILANLRINSPEKLESLKNSFLSFNTISDNWVINVRGEFRDDAIIFLKKQLGDKLVLFNLLDESRGWIKNVQDMMGAVKSPYLFLWNEEQVNIAPQSVYKDIVKEMAETNSDYLMYSWWLDGKSREHINILPQIKKTNIDVVDLTVKSWKRVIGIGGHPYFVVSLIAIYKKEFFQRIMEIDSRWMLPVGTRKNIYRIESMLIRFGLPIKAGDFFWFVNRLTGYRISHWPSGPPFNIEKHKERFDVLPFRMALPKQELFVCIDDDLDMPGYQLIKRGLYPPPSPLKIDSGQVAKTAWGEIELLEENDYYRVERIKLNAGAHYSNVYYEDYGQRTPSLVRATFVLLEGKISLKSDGGTVSLSIGETTSLYPNKSYSVSSLENSIFLSILPTYKGKKIVKKA
jgi:hypothetical protein